MPRKEQQRKITGKMIEKFALSMQEDEKSDATVKKYLRDLRGFSDFLQDTPVTKGAVLCWKEHLIERYSAVSVNSMLAAGNAFFQFCGWNDCRVKQMKIQRKVFRCEERELSREEYLRLVKAAGSKGQERLALVMQTICATGIRVSELKFITVEAVQIGRAVVNCKGKTRTVFLADKLCKALKPYIRKQKRTAGPVFITRTGNPLDRSNIWREMKNLCESAGVKPGKVFPHNLRHLFARVYYTLEKDLSRLADILGHTSINTTRVYTMESGAVHAKQIERMRLVVT